MEQSNIWVTAPSEPLINPEGDQIYNIQENDTFQRSGETTACETKRNVSVCWVHPIWINILLSIMVLLSSICTTVTLPIYTDAVVAAGSDPFTVSLFVAFGAMGMTFVMTLLYKALSPRSINMRPQKWSTLVLIGFLNALGGILIVYASYANRTPPYLQPILSNTVILSTMIFQLIILRKGISLRKLIATGTILIGMFLVMEPVIFDFKGNDFTSSENSSHSSIGGVMWSLIFTAGYVPLSAANIFTEREMKRDQVNVFMVLCCCQVFAVVTLILFFCTDFIPEFGMASTAKEFFQHLHIGFKCHFSLDKSCYDIVTKFWIFTVAFGVGMLSQFLLMRYGEGAVYTVIISTLGTPCSTLFWSCFKPNPLHWGPEFTATTAFTLAGLSIIVPAIVVYNVFSQWDAKLASDKTLEEEPILG